MRRAPIHHKTQPRAGPLRHVGENRARGADAHSFFPLRACPRNPRARPHARRGRGARLFWGSADRAGGRVSISSAKTARPIRRRCLTTRLSGAVSSHSLSQPARASQGPRLTYVRQAKKAAPAALRLRLFFRNFVWLLPQYATRGLLLYPSHSI